MRKLTKADLENLAKEIRCWASKNGLGKDWSLFYNGIRLNYPLEENEDGNYEYRRLPVRETENPLNYCEYFPEKFIMGMSYDGVMYECINGYSKFKAYEKLEEILSSYGLYLEHCDSCHVCMCEAEDMEVEYTIYEREKIVRLYGPGRARYEHDYNSDDVEHPRELDNVMKFWMAESAKVGDKGACTRGEYLEFDYKGKVYRMSSQTPYQGELSWQEPLPRVKEMLASMGATDMYMNYGMLD